MAIDDLSNIIGYAAAFLTTFSFLPQAIKTIKTRCTSGISVLMYCLFTSGIFLWLVYGILKEDPIIISANAVTFAFSFTILIIAAINLRKKNKVESESLLLNK
ncbi:SemiSWEET family sugar transporter [Fluviispira sanaruensis]|uniref:MtN3 and saliva related transmembrane protein n=1 Tax=Fluviispira sanaruensis TaxID=2493639 RepID=A0A4P2VJU3_FLUSA|nr:SemiSWEET transporter [Fluviispira sanaruensis]BBH51890.1 hypothetical protein JCM31447_03150 [Fluviispira sanaruensis]